MKTITQATTGQIKQNSRFLEDAFQKLRTEVETMFGGLDSKNAQRFLGNGNEFIADVRKTALDSFGQMSVTNQFVSEEVPSKYGYPSGYKPKGLAEQVKRLRELFPGIGEASEKLASVTLPTNTEGWFAIPRWQTLAKTYGQAVQKVLDVIKQTRGGKFYNHREGQLGPNQLRQLARTEKFFCDLAEAQGNPDILIVPAQFGLMHAGKSVRRAREVFLVNEFGLGAFAVGIMLLTHPDRLQHYDDLWIDCAGDEFAPVADGQFSNAPCFDGFGGVELEFDADDVSRAHDRCGSASGFSPQ